MGTTRRLVARTGVASLLNPFMAIGDSTTYGYPSFLGAWRSTLLSLAPTIQISGSMIEHGEHDGYSGSRIDQIRTSVLPIIQQLQPSTILLQAGINDIVQGQSAASTLTEYRALAEEFLATSPARLKHILASTIAGDDVGIQSFNAGLVAAFAGCDSRIIVVDTVSALAYPGDYDGDHYHPNPTGYAKIGTGWFNAITAQGLIP